MTLNNDNSHEAGCFLSVRSSCDRCRIQKLKCSVPVGSGACERCTRAKLPCVFGRRTRSRRPPSNERKQHNAHRMGTLSPTIHGAPLTPFTPIPSLPTPPISTSSSSSSATAPQWDFPPTPVQYMRLADPLDSLSGPAAPAPDLEPDTGSYHIRPWDHITNDVLDCETDASSYRWSQPGFDAGNTNANMLEDGGQWYTQIGGWTSTEPPLDIPGAAKCQGGGARSNNTILTSERLVALILEIQQRLRKLEEGPWHEDSARSLDDYPVGAVLQLSEHFTIIAGLVLNQDGADGRPHTNEGPVEENDGGASDRTSSAQSDRETMGCVVDTPTILVLLSGYMWLVRIIDMVLCHFQKYLDRMPSRHFHSGSGHGSAAAAGQTLRLGDLHCANAALSLQRIHIAVSMLLDALHSVERHLGCGGKVVRDLTAAMLLNNNSGRLPNDGCGGLVERATTVKDLLRKKMGL